MLPEQPEMEESGAAREWPRDRQMRRRSRFDVGWQDWAVAIALGAIVVLLGAIALVTWGGWSHQRDVARAMEPPPKDDSPPLRVQPAPAKSAPAPAPAAH